MKRFPIICGRLLCLALLAGALAAMAEEKGKVVNIPYCDAAVAERLRSGDPFEASSWDGAARLGKLVAPGGAPVIPEATEILLQYDGDTLFVLAHCRDTGSDGRAFRRGPTEDLTLDESIEIDLGTGNLEGAKLQFGGYEGAFSELGSVEHFHQFGCNRAGSIGRRYDETALPEPKFTGEVRENADGWSAFLAIPLASAGLEPGPQVVHFNAFRFYRSGRYGWSLPGWGSYVPTPFATAQLLPEGLQKERTLEAVETAPPVKAAAAAEVKKAATGTIEYYPLQRAVVAQFPAGKASQLVSVTLDDESASAPVALSPIRSTVVRLACDRPEGAAVRAEAKIDGAVVATVSGVVPPRPEWADSDAGIAYLDEKVSRPWAPLQVHGGDIAGVLTTIGFGDGGMLPQTIRVGEESVLAAPVTIRAEAGGKVLPVNARAGMTGQGPWVLLKSEDKPGIEVRTRVEYDGFTIIRLRLDGVAATELSQLEIRIPLNEKWARFVHRGSAQTLVEPGGFGYVGNAGEMWVGDVHAGLFFDFDRKLFFSPSDGRQVELLAAKDGAAELVLRLVTAPGQVTDPEQVFQFFLLPTPVRNDFIPPDKNQLELWFENWSDYQGYPDLAKMPEVQRRVGEAHTKGKRFYLYFSQVLAENSPGYEWYRSEWIAPPERPWSKRAYDPGKDIPCRVMCFRGAAGALMLDGVRKLVEEGGIDAVYLDGPTHPFDCSNPSHACDDRLNASWEGDYTSGRVLGQRAYLKRLRGILNDAGSNFPLWAHTGGGLSISTLALSDFFFEGEQLARYRTGYLLEPEKMLINYSGAPYGFRGLFLPVLYFDNWECTRALPWGLLHGVSSFEFADLQTVYFDHFNRANGVFHPYWEAQPELERLSQDGALISYWIGDDRAMLVASNLRYQGPQQIEVDVKDFFPARELAVQCLDTPGDYQIDGSILRFTVPVSEMRLFLIAPADAGVVAVDK